MRRGEKLEGWGKSVFDGSKKPPELIAETHSLRSDVSSMSSKSINGCGHMAIQPNSLMAE